MVPRPLRQEASERPLKLSMRTHSHVAPTMQKEAADLVDRLLSGSGGPS
jgi:hypothetical protein